MKVEVQVRITRADGYNTHELVSSVVSDTVPGDADPLSKAPALFDPAALVRSVESCAEDAISRVTDQLGEVKKQNRATLRALDAERDRAEPVEADRPF